MIAFLFTILATAWMIYVSLLRDPSELQGLTLYSGTLSAVDAICLRLLCSMCIYRIQ